MSSRFRSPPSLLSVRSCSAPLGVLRETTAIWIALVIGLGTLAAAGIAYARIERMGRGGTLVVVAVNLAFGLALVALKAALAH